MRSIRSWAQKLAAERDETFCEALHAIGSAVLNEELPMFAAGTGEPVDVSTIVVRNLFDFRDLDGGGADALAKIFLDDFTITTADMARWLRSLGIDEEITARKVARRRVERWCNEKYPSGKPPSISAKKIARDYENETGETTSESTVRRAFGLKQ